MRITTSTKAKINLVQDLLNDKKVRDEAGLFIVEGGKIIADYLDAGIDFDSLFFLKDNQKQMGAILSKASARGIALFELKDEHYRKLSYLKNGPGIIGVAKKKKWDFASYIQRDPYFAVCCDGIQDPGNLGSILRLSLAFGVDFLVLNNTVDIYNPKIVRASSGALIHIPSFCLDHKEISSLLNQDAKIFSSVPPHVGKSVELQEIKTLPPQTIVCFGAEGKGLSEDIKRHTSIFYTIQIASSIDSLNVAQAAAISLYHFSSLRKHF